MKTNALLAAAVGIAMDSNAYAAFADAANRPAILAELEAAGIVFDSGLGQVGFLHRPAREVRLRPTVDGANAHNPRGVFSYDAQPELVLNQNAGIPAWLTNYMDPQLIHILTSPNKAVQIMGGEQQYGDWTTTTYTATTVQHMGEVSAYGDYNTNGMSSAVMNFPQRQSFAYQIFTQWGEKQLAMAANARVNYANEVNEASMRQMANYQNLTYFFGVSGLANYGLLNDPSLSAAIVATSRWNASGTSAETIYEDIRRLFVQVQLQSNGVIDAQSPIVLAMSPVIALALNKTNQYNVNVYDQLRKNFPNIRFETAVQYGQNNYTAPLGGELVQMIVESVNGVRTAQPAFTEKMRAHAVVIGASSWSQKKSAGSFGTIIKNPFAISSMTGM